MSLKKNFGLVFMVQKYTLSIPSQLPTTPSVVELFNLVRLIHILERHLQGRSLGEEPEQEEIRPSAGSLHK